MSESFAVYCSELPGCVCEMCLYRWSGRCPYGDCFDDLRAQINPYDKAHPGESPRMSWSNWKTDQAYWCRGGIFYQTHECDKYVEYEELKHIIKECLDAMVSVYQDGYTSCSLVESVGCEECMKRFNEKMDEREYIELAEQNCNTNYSKNEEVSMIKNIEITKLHPHPDNPRRDLGDLTELAESIKSRGILQNLTVVPNVIGSKTDYPTEDGYCIVIGHRRYAAAKLAGLKEVPCVVCEMNHHDQVATMLLENIQRSDLTIWEQAQGFQMMMDLGDSINDISGRTGFSETTVRRRVKLLDLDGEKFRKSVERGATLMDYAELDKISDIKLRNSVLDKFGTPNFRYELQQAIDKETKNKNIALIISELKKFATEIKDSNGLQYINYYGGLQKPDIKVPDDAHTEEYFYKVSNYGSVELYKKYIKSRTNVVQDPKQKEINERHAALDEISKRAYRLRYDFIREISNTVAKKNISIIAEWSVRAMLGYSEIDYDEFADFLGIHVNDDEELSFDNFAELISTQPERHLLTATYLELDSDREHYYNWNNQHNDNETLNTVYDFLEKLGYETSDEERSLRDGTHKLFQSSDNV